MRKCFGCGGLGHMARNLLFRADHAFFSRQPQPLRQMQSPRPARAQRILLDATNYGVHIADALIDTDLAFSMLSTAMYGWLLSATEFSALRGRLFM